MLQSLIYSRNLLHKITKLAAGCPRCSIDKSSKLIDNLQPIRSIQSTCQFNQDKTSGNGTRTSVDDEIHELIAGGEARPKERKPWVGYNPFRDTASADWMSFLSRRRDWDTFIEDRMASAEMARLRDMQEYAVERVKMIGGELMAASFVVAMNGKVKLHNDDHWYSKETKKVKSLPMERTYGLKVEAADLSNTDLLYEGLENLFHVEQLLYLSLANCSRLDEWGMSRLAMIPSLISLDLSGNEFITERSLIPLQHVPNLQKLNLTGIKYFTNQPLALMYLEQLLPNCVITTDEVV